MEFLIGFAMIAFVILLGIGMWVLPVPGHKQQIIKSLEKKKARHIHTHWEWVHSGGGYHSYVVTFDDSNGVLQQKSCRVDMSTDEIYWKDES